MQKTIVITGASNGFGKLTTKLLLDQGHTVIAAVRGGEARLAKLFGQETLDTRRLRGVDVHLDKNETFAALRTLVDNDFGGKLDVLINNAGYGALGPIEEQSEEDIRQQMEVNCVGPMLLTNMLLPALRAAKGRILNVTGVTGYVAMPFYALYCASKYAMEGYSEALSYDLKPLGVQVGIIEPGGFRTGFTDTAANAANVLPEHSPYKARAEAMTHFLRHEAVKMNGDPMVVAKTIAKLSVKRRVPMRTKVGTDAVMLSTLNWLVPDRARMWMIEFAMDKTLFGTQPAPKTAHPTDADSINENVALQTQVQLETQVQ